MGTDEAPDLRLIHPAPPPEERKILPNAVLGTILFIMTEVMMFGGFISAHSIARTSVPIWPPPGQPLLPVAATALNTAALIASGLLMFYAGRKFTESPDSAKRPMMASVILGALFVGLQGSEWAQLIAAGLTMSTSVHAAFFYLIVGAHGLHAIGGLCAVLWLYYHLTQGTLDKDSFRAGRIFWYFVVGLWPIIYWQVYW